MFFASRTLLGLANEGMAHKRFLTTNRFGQVNSLRASILPSSNLYSVYRTPYIAVLTSSLFGAAAYLSVQYHSMQVLLWLLNLSTVAGLVSWVVLCAAYLRMHAGMKAQGYSRDGMLMLLSVFVIGCPRLTCMHLILSL